MKCYKQRKTQCINNETCNWIEGKNCKKRCPKKYYYNEEKKICKKQTNKLLKTKDQKITCTNDKTLTPNGKTCKHVYLLDSGSYGCVIYPPISEKQYVIKEIIKYKNKKDDDLGKIFKNGKTDFEVELAELIRIQKIDKEGVFTNKLKGVSELKGDLFDYDENLHRCLKRHYYEKSVYYQIIFENGGVSVGKIIDKIAFKKMFKLIKNFLSGIRKLYYNKFVHLDVYYKNVLINDKKISLIDFGLSQNAEDVYNYENIYLFDIINEDNMNYPPEFAVIYLLYKKLPNKFTYQEYVSVLDGIYKYIIDNDFIDNHERMLLEIFNSYEGRQEYIAHIKDFIETIKKEKITDIHQIFNENLALKIDVYGFSYIFIDLYKKTIFDNEKQKIFFKKLIFNCYEPNPLIRKNFVQLYNSFIIDSKEL